MTDRAERAPLNRAALESLLSADLRALTAQSDRIGRIFAQEHQLSSAEFDALLHIMVGEAARAPLTAGQLQQRLRLTNSGTTYLLQRMIASGHIRRDTDPADRRKAVLRHEKRGSALAEKFFTRLGAANRAAMTTFTNSELDTAHRVMSTMTTVMDHFYTELQRPPES